MAPHPAHVHRYIAGGSLCQRRDVECDHAHAPGGHLQVEDIDAGVVLWARVRVRGGVGVRARVRVGVRVGISKGSGSFGLA